MKKLLILLLALLCMCCGAAAAEKAEHASTQAFADVLDRAGQPYTLDGMDEDGCEYLLLENKGDPFPYTVTIMFEENQENASIRVWYVIEYEAARADEVMRVCNTLNAQNRFVSFYADESDHTVTASMDLIFRGSDAGRVTAEAVRRLTDTLHAAWPSLRACTMPVNAVVNTPAPAQRAEATPAPVRVTAAATPAPTQNSAGRKVVITTDSAVLRSAPNAAGSYVATAKQGESFECLGTANGWYAIDYHGRRAYVSTGRAELQ